MSEIRLQLTQDAEEQLGKVLFKSTRNLLGEIVERQLVAKDYMTKAETAKYCNVSTVTITSWQQEYGLKSIQLGGKLLFSKNTVDEFLISHEK